MSMSILSAGTWPGPWHVGNTIGSGSGWFIVDIRTNKTKFIGGINAKRTNHFDNAQREANQRNAKIFNDARANSTLPTLLGINADMDQAVAMFLQDDTCTLDKIREAADLAARIFHAANTDPMQQCYTDLRSGRLPNTYRTKDEVVKVLSYAREKPTQDVINRLLKYFD
jgi:hypothetical protein